MSRGAFFLPYYHQVAIQSPIGARKIWGKINYRDKNAFNCIPERSRRAEPVPMMYKNYSYAAVDPTTPPELGDRAV